MIKEFYSSKLKGVNQDTIKPCSLCRSPMSCYDTSIISGESHARAHYLVACSVCGYGPAQAYTTVTEAINHWNESVKLPKAVNCA